MTHFKPRADAIWLNNPSRRFVPTVYGQQSGNTRWASTFEEFKAMGGVMHFSEDQTEIYLTLPEGCKFSCQFPNPRT